MTLQNVTLFNVVLYLQSLWLGDLLFVGMTVEDVVVPLARGAGPDVGHGVAQLLHVVQISWDTGVF